MRLAALLSLVAAVSWAAPARHATLPAPSPDGRTLVFVSERDSTPELYLLDVASGLERRLTYSSAREILPQWDAAGRRVLYTVATGDTLDLLAVAADGAPLGRITSRTAKSLRATSDARRFAWTSGSWTRNRIWVQDSLRARPRALTDSTNAWYNLAWHPGGDTLAATRSDSSGALQIWLLSRHAKHARPLVAVAMDVGRPQFPAWSPDGRTIAFQLNVSREDAYVCTVDVASGTITRLREHPSPMLDEAPAWLDRDRLVFQSSQSGAFELWVMRADGSDAKRLTRD